MKTPFYTKTSPDFEWPKDPMFYLLTGSGVFKCRNHPFFRSSVKVDKVPDLPEHLEALTSSYPKLSQAQFESIVGWFRAVAHKHDSECAVLLAWSKEGGVQLVVPKQTCNSWKAEYDLPNPPPGCIWIGDVHSHVDMSAFSSYVDKDDEKFKAGVHIIVGKIYDNPPEIEVKIVADGQHFKAERHLVIEGYEKLGHWPGDWMQQLTIVKPKWSLPWKRGKENKGSMGAREYDEWLERRAQDHHGMYGHYHD